MYVERDLEKTLKKYLSSKEIIAVVGTRQCGKTTLIKHILNNKKNVNHISFDNIKELALFESNIDEFIKLHVQGYDYLFIDEVQYSKNSGKKLKYIYDSSKIKIIISGSSAAEISIQSLKYLVGRIFVFKLYPFSFGEFLSYKNPKLRDFYEEGSYSKEILLRINNLLEEYLLFGGYPRVVLSKDEAEKKIVLDNIYNTYLLKEIKELLQLSNNYKLIALLKALSLQIGNVINYKELSDTTGFSFVDLKKYLQILEETYICERLPPFFTNKRTELVKSPKIYFLDLGFRNICLDNFGKERPDKGAIYENFVFSELKRKSLKINFWQKKTGVEVDFILGEKTPVEIKSVLKAEKISKSFMSFISSYKPKKAYVSSIDFESEKDKESTKIRFLPFVKLVKQL